jgi:L-alanine-DL-glutamate epimerase-like enolase superfamily enzyme
MLKEAGIRIAADITREFYLGEPIPPLAALVCVSPLDVAVHDAFGKAYGIDTYDGYAPEMCCDLSRWLGEDFRGRYLNDFISPEYRTPIPIWHLVGGLDKLRRGEKRDDDPDDGLPVSLDEWIARDGVFCFKVKLRGNDLDWDLDRTKEVFEVARRSLLKKGIDALYLSVDMNEQCESPEYCVEFLEKLRGDPNTGRDAFDALLFLEQPVERNLRNRSFDMRPVARIKPVLADEGIVHLEDVDVAFELGWSGVALKTCKGHSCALLTAAKTAAAGKIYTVQDLTNPGLALIHSVGMAARLSPLKGVEANARQFIPQANDTIEDPAFQAGLVNIRDGFARWPRQGAVGLGY